MAYESASASVVTLNRVPAVLPLAGRDRAASRFSEEPARLYVEESSHAAQAWAKSAKQCPSHCLQP